MDGSLINFAFVDEEVETLHILPEHHSNKSCHTYEDVMSRI